MKNILILILLLSTNCANKKFNLKSFYKGGNNYLIQAVMKQDLNMLIEAQNERLNPNIQDERGNTPLHYALLISHDIGMINIILDMAPNLNIKNNQGNTPLHIAVMNGTLNIVILLIERGANVYIENNRGESILHTAVEYGHLPILKYMKDGNFFRGNLNMTDIEGNTLFHTACKKEDENILTYLLSLEDNIRGDINLQNINGIAPLHIASEKGLLNIAKYLIDKNDYRDIEDNKGETPLYKACLNGHKEIVQFLINKNANIKVINNDGNTLLHAAVLSRNINLINYLIVNESLKLDSENEEYMTPLALSIDKDYLEVAEVLIKEGAKIITLDSMNNPLSFMEGEGYKIKILYSITSPLYLILEKGHINLLKLIKELDINIPNSLKEMKCKIKDIFKFKNEELIKYLINEDIIPIDFRDKYNQSLLHFAVLYKLYSVLEFLLERNNNNIDKTDKGGLNPLHLACSIGDSKSIKILINRGANVNKKCELPQCSKSFSGYNNLHLLIDKKVYGKIQKGLGGNYCFKIKKKLSSEQIIDNISYLFESNIEIYNEELLMYLAVEYCSEKLDLIKFLLMKNVNFRIKNEDGETLLHKAAKDGNVEMVKLFLSLGLDINAKDNNDCSVLYYACEESSLDTIKFLLENGAKVSEGFKNKATSYNILHIISERGNVEIFNYLIADLEKILKINEKDEGGKTALHIASYEGHKEIVELLLNRGINANEKNKVGETALHIASYEGHKEIVELLLNRGINANEKNKMGETVLHKASHRGHKEIAELLLDRGASINEKDNNGWTALHKACLFCSKKILKLLLNRGASINEKN